MITSSKEKKFFEIAKKVDELERDPSVNLSISVKYKELIESLEKEFATLERSYSSDENNLYFISTNFYSRKAFYLVHRSHSAEGIYLFSVAIFNAIKKRMLASKSLVNWWQIYNIKISKVVRLLDNYVVDLDNDLQFFYKLKNLLLKDGGLMFLLLSIKKKIDKNELQQFIKMIYNFLRAVLKLSIILLNKIPDEHLKNFEDLYLSLISWIQENKIFEDKTNKNFLIGSINSYLFRVNKRLFLRKIRQNNSNFEREIQKMRTYSKNAVKCLKKLSSINKELYKIFFGAKIDEYFAKYYNTVYLEKNPLKGLRYLRDIYRLLISHPHMASKEQTNYVLFETYLVSIFCDLKLAELEVNKSLRRLSKIIKSNNNLKKIYENIKTIGNEITRIIHIFKNIQWDPNKSINAERVFYEKSLFGQVSAFILYQLLKCIKENQFKISLRQGYPRDSSLEIVINLINSEDSLPSFNISDKENTVSDLDILFQKVVITVKNSRYLSNLENEMEFAKRKKVSHFILAYNIIKIPELTASYDQLRKIANSKGLKFYVIDLFDLVEILAKSLQERGKYDLGIPIKNLKLILGYLG